MSDLWTGKPFMKKTLIKFAIIFIVITAILSYVFLPLPFNIGLYVVGFWVLIALVYFGVYYLSKRAFTYHITDKSVRIEKSWIFGN